MRTEYISPSITVEELTKADVLCTSTVVNVLSANEGPSSVPTDNANQTFGTLANFANFM